MTPLEAVGHVRSWLEQPPVQVLAYDPDHIRHTLKLLETLGTAGNLVTDAQMAAQAMDHDAVLHTTDADFVRFHDCVGSTPSREPAVSNCGEESLPKPAAIHPLHCEPLGFT